MIDDRKFEVPPHVIMRDVGGQAVILDLKSGEYYELNQMAQAILDLFSKKKSLREIHALILEDYDVDAETLRRDIERLVAELVAKKIIIES